MRHRRGEIQSCAHTQAETNSDPDGQAHVTRMEEMGKKSPDKGRPSWALTQAESGGQPARDHQTHEDPDRNSHLDTQAERARDSVIQKE